MIDRSRRTFVTGGLSLVSLCAAGAAGAAIADADDEVIQLWPGIPPGGENVVLTQHVDDRIAGNGLRSRRISGIGNPVLVVKRAPRPNGAAVIIVPGGGFSVLNYDLSGLEPARWLNARGITAFVLVHRLPGEGWKGRADVPLQDAQRAIRLVRARAGQLDIDAGRIGVLGFSAGGFVAGSLATRFARPVYDPVDSCDALSARPDLAALLFPVITMGTHAHAPSRTQLLGDNSPSAVRDANSLERQVPIDAPPTFLCCAGDDQVVSPVNSIAMYQALLDARIKSELHVFQRGGHGFALRLPASQPAAIWPELMLGFARSNRLLA